MWLMLMTLRWIYLLLGTFLLCGAGMLCAAAGHAPLTMIETMGSWYSLLVRAAHFADALLLQGWLWNSTIESAGGLGVVIGNIGIPLGFVLFYSLLRWFVALKFKGRSQPWFAVLYALGSGLAFLLNALHNGGRFAFPLVATLGSLGVLLGLGFVCVDSIILRLINAHASRVSP